MGLAFTVFRIFMLLVVVCVLYYICVSDVVGYHRNPEYIQNVSFRRRQRAWDWLQPIMPKNVSASSRKILCLLHRGRLGNQMFQFSAGYSVSKRYGRKLVIDSAMDENLRTVFHMRLRRTRSRPYAVGSCDNMKKYRYTKRRFQNVSLENYSHDDIKLDGYFESWKYFYKDIDDIVNLFALNVEHKHIAKAAIQRQSAENVTMIGIQVRRGDIETQQSLAPWPYFQQAMNYYKQKYTKVHFFVASNEIKWCQVHFQNTSDVTLLTGNRYEDLAVLSECDHSIMSVGTFSWWSAFLAKGTVVYYTDVNRTVPKGFLDSDFYLPHWIPMSGRKLE